MLTPPEAERLLRALVPADEREARHRDQMLALLAHTDAPFRRDQFTPGHFTVSAFILSPGGGELLLILHRKLGLWLQPGGHIEGDDRDLLEAARRECREETALGDLELVGAGLFDVDVHTIPANRREPAHLHHDLRFLFRSRTTALRPTDHVAGARWVALDRIAEVQSDESVMRAVRKLRGTATSGPRG